MSSKSAGIFAIRGNVSRSTTFGTQGRVCDASGLRVLPWTKNPVVIFPQCAIESG